MANKAGLAGVIIGVIGIGVAVAEPFVDYTPEKGTWEIQTRTISRPTSMII